MHIAILPSGHLSLHHFEAVHPESVQNLSSLQTWFEQGIEVGILRLAASKRDCQDLSLTLAYWQCFGHLFIEQTRKTGPGLETIPLVDEQDLLTFLEQAPPMLGGEYLNLTVLNTLWHQVSVALLVELKPFKGNFFDYLTSYHHDWQQMGRVCFHLAENKKNTSLPFAFLATYTKDEVSKQALHVPLGQALKEYANAQDKNQLYHLLSPVQRAAQTIPLIKNLMETRNIFHPQAWSGHEAHQFLLAIPQMEDAGIHVKVPNWWSVQHPPRPQVRIAIGNKATALMGLQSLLDFDVQYTLPSGESLTKEEMENLRQSTENLVQVKGQWVVVDHQKLTAVLSHWEQVKNDVQEKGLTFAESLRLLAGGTTQTNAEGLLEDLHHWSTITEGEWLKDILKQLRCPHQLNNQSVTRILQTHLRATLRPYQIQGVQWLWFLYQLGLGGCLADDMGLGKTIQVLSLLLLIKNLAESPAPKNASLLIVPASLLGNWQREIQKFSPQLSVWIAHNSVSAQKKSDLEHADLVITTYANVYRLPWIKEYHWQAIILDEAQNIKNPTTKQTAAIKSLHSQVRFVLTGTPVENKLLDLWSLFDFCCPGLLGGRKEFSTYGKKKTEEQGEERYFYGMVRKLISPYILRRLKTDKTIIADLPDKTEVEVDCFLSKQQIALYQQTMDDLEEKLKQEDLERIERKGIVLASITKLKQICNHPSQWLGHGKYEEQESGKFVQLRTLAEMIAEKQEKVLIFTQYQEMIPPLHTFLAQIFNQDGLILHGGTPIKERQQHVESFQQEEGPPFFVLSLKAGGTGLTLTNASHVIHFDRWWNPAVENQATDRAYRIGQKKNVLVHKFICQGTLEEKIDAMMTKKKELASDLLEETSNGFFLTELSDNKILQLLSLDIHQVCDDKQDL